MARNKPVNSDISDQLAQLKAKLAAARKRENLAKADRKELARVKRALEASEEKFGAIFDAAPFAMALTTISDNVLCDVNTAWLKQTGFACKEEVLGKTIQELGVLPNTETAENLLKEFLEHGFVRDSEITMLHTSGSNRAVLASLYPVNLGGCMFILLVLRDITVRKLAEESARRNESILRAVSDNTQDAIYVKDCDSRILFANPATLRIVGKPPERIIGHRDDEFYDDPAISAAILEHDRRIIKKGEPQSLEENVETPQGCRIFLSNKVPWRDSEGRVIGLIGISRDITERKQAEQQLKDLNDSLEKRVEERTAEAECRALQLRQLMTDLVLAEQRERRQLSQVLHDGLQQILVGAKYQLAMILRSPDMQQAVSQLEELLADAIETSRSLTAELSPPILLRDDLVSAIEWLARWMRDKHGLDIDLVAHKKVQPLTQSVLLLLFQTARELLFNVAKHAGVRKARIEIDQLDGRVQLVIEDEGAGFDVQKLNSEKDRLGGIGLFSVRERLSYVGGSMEIDSVPGRGSRFKMIIPILAVPEPVGPLPATDQPHVSVMIPSQLTSASGEGAIRIVLVDDHMVLRQGLAGLLRCEPDFEVAGEASDGESAVILVQKLRPDVVLMDVSMPGMDGIQATRTIHAKLPEIRIIGLSMFEKGEPEVAMREAGAVDYLAKSGPSEKLIQSIRSCVNRTQTHAMRN